MTIQNIKEIVVILAAGAKKDASGRWVSTDLLEDERWGSPGGRMRVLAASVLYQKDPSRVIIASGGRGWDIKQDESQRPNLAGIIKHELMESGVPEEKIIEETASNTTFEQLFELKKIIQHGQYKSVLIISNEWHLPRIKAMLNYKDDLKELKKITEVKLISAEKVLMKHNKNQWQKIIRVSYDSKAMKQRIILEKQGIKLIKNNSYNYDAH